MQQKLSSKEKKSILNIMQRRLSWEFIKDQHRLIRHMSPNLSIPLHHIHTDPMWRSISIQKIKSAILQIPFLKVQSFSGLASPIVKFQYENADKIVIVTGIRTDKIQEFLMDFMKSVAASKRFQILNRKDMKHWYSIELNSFDAAISCKKFIRNIKAQYDQIGNTSYKIIRRRVRIVLLNQDFYTILVDAMMETKTQKFIDCFNKSPFQGITYYPLSLENRAETKAQEQVDDTNSWQFQSKSSQFYYEDKMNDIDIEKVNQGIQYQKIEAALAEEQEVVGEEQQGIWTQTSQENILFIPEDKNKAQTQQKQRHEGDNNPKVESEDEQKAEIDKKVEKQQRKYEKDSKQSQLKTKLRSLSLGISPHQQQNTQTNDYPTQTSRIILQNNNVERPKYIYPSATSPTKKQKSNNQSITQFEVQKPSQLIQENILQISCAGMRKKFHQYLNKVGRKQIDIPIYIKRETDRVIFKNKFFDQVIRQANQTRLNKY